VDLAQVPADQAAAVELAAAMDREVAQAAGATAMVAAVDPVRVTAATATATGRDMGLDRVAQAPVETPGHGTFWAVAAEDRDWIQMLEASG
jgi:hypothetical protein